MILRPEGSSNVSKEGNLTTGVGKFFYEVEKRCKVRFYQNAYELGDQLHLI